LASRTDRLTGADIAYLCRQAAMLCVKEATSVSRAAGDIAIARHHFDAAFDALTVARSSDATQERPRLLLAE